MQKVLLENFCTVSPKNEEKWHISCPLIRKATNSIAEIKEISHEQWTGHIKHFFKDKYHHEDDEDQYVFNACKSFT